MTAVTGLLRLVAVRPVAALGRGLGGLPAVGARAGAAATGGTAGARGGGGLALLRLLDPEVAHHLLELVPRDALRRVGRLREAVAAARVLRRDVDRRAGGRDRVRRQLAAELAADPLLTAPVDRLALLPVREHRTGDEHR